MGDHHILTRIYWTDSRFVFQVFVFFRFRVLGFLGFVFCVFVFLCSFRLEKKCLFITLLNGAIPITILVDDVL